jgi:hypothetical protein
VKSDVRTPGNRRWPASLLVPLLLSGRAPTPAHDLLFSDADETLSTSPTRRSSVLLDAALAAEVVE